MSKWRRKAIALFPELRTRSSLNDPEFSIYMLFFDLLPMSREAHDDHDDGLLKRIYGYAEWCSHQLSKELWNPAAVAFWEHVFDPPRLREVVVTWVSPYIIAEITSLWEGFTLKPDEWAQVKALIANRKEHRYRESVFWTGEIDNL